MDYLRRPIRIFPARDLRQLAEWEGSGLFPAAMAHAHLIGSSALAAGPSLNIAGSPPAVMTQGDAVNFALTISGGVPPYNMTLLGTQPPGFAGNLSGSTYEANFIAGAASSGSMTFRVTDSASGQADLPWEWEIIQFDADFALSATTAQTLYDIQTIGFIQSSLPGGEYEVVSGPGFVVTGG